jgi:hypothetical protein
MASSKKKGTYERTETIRHARPPLYYIKSHGKVIDIVDTLPRLSSFVGSDIEIWHWDSKLSMRLVAKRVAGRDIQPRN